MLMKMTSDDSKRDLQSFISYDELSMLTVDADEGNGELSITIPDSFKELMKSFLDFFHFVCILN